MKEENKIYRFEDFDYLGTSDSKPLGIILSNDDKIILIFRPSEILPKQPTRDVKA